MNKEFEGKYAVVTGGAGGISYEAAKTLAKKGLSGVVLADLNFEQATESAKKLEEEIGCHCYPCKVDVSNPEDIEHLFEFALEKMPAVHILINGAGVCPTTPIEDLDADKWDWCMNINLRGAHLCVREAIKTMKKQKYGKIINISSMWGITGGSCEVHYSAAKAAVIGFTKALAKELGPSGICVNCVAPGVIETEMNSHLTKEDFDCLCEETPLERLGKPEEVAKTVRFLASENADFITGQVVNVDGGMVI